MTTITLSLFLNLNGQAEEGLTFYQTVFKGELLFKITNQQFKEKMDPELLIPKGEETFISHSVLQIGGTQLNIVDNPIYPSMPLTMGQALSFSVTTGTVEEAKTLFDAIQSDSRSKVIAQPMENEFADYYGIIQDPFGVIIQVSREKQPDPSLKG